MTVTLLCHSGYNPADYAHLNVPTDVRELFQYIGRYKPHNVELETKIRCFIPEYIPAVGEIDAFMKPPRPDGQPETLGLTELDEPSSHQSDPTVVDLQARALSKKSGLEPVLVRSIEHAEKNPKEVSKWISSITELHRNKPPPQVQYKRPMPDVESLMQEWPQDFEAKLSEVRHEHLLLVFFVWVQYWGGGAWLAVVAALMLSCHLLAVSGCADMLVCVVFLVRVRVGTAVPAIG